MRAAPGTRLPCTTLPTHPLPHPAPPPNPHPHPPSQVLHELLDMLRLQGQAQHSDFLEVIIIVLICVGEWQLIGGNGT